MLLGNLYLVEVTVKCMPGLVRDSYLSLYDLHPPPEVPGWSDEVSRSYHSPPLLGNRPYFEVLGTLQPAEVIYSPFRRLFYFPK